MRDRIKSVSKLRIILQLGLLVAAWATSALCADEPGDASRPTSCVEGIPGGVNCVFAPRDLKKARKAYEEGVKLREHRRLSLALARFDEASRLMPENYQYLTAREMIKSQLVFDHIERGNQLLLENERPRAAAEFRAAVELDPDNQFARDRLGDAVVASAPALMEAPVLFTDADELRLQPSSALATFHFRGDLRDLFTQLALAYGVKVQFDDALQARQVTFNIGDVDFYTALRLACRVSKTMWTPLGTQQFLVAPDTQENHKQYDRMFLRTFTLPPHSSPTEATELINTLRNVFDLRFINSGQTVDTVEVRGPQPVLDAAAKLLAQITGERPQVMFDVRVYQISHMLTRDIGVHIPNTFNMFNIPAGALAALGGQNIQQLINQLIASGGINQAGSSALSALLAQLQGQQNSIFSQPLATFGGGLTFMGVSLDHLTTALSLNESWMQSLEHVTLRASQGNEATFHLGSRYPILNASYAPIYNSSAIAQVLGNQTYVPPFPSVSYEDLGLNLKAKPVVHANGDVSLQVELQVRSLTGQSANGVPVVSNREYKGSINLRDGEPAVVAGEVSETDQLSLSGIPGLGFFPGLNSVMVSNTRQRESDELMIILTPHVISNFARDTDEIWIGQN
jgi:tetratricopeptide (TPR) repeat protein